jgi:DNA-binding NtrC family response regulator
MTKILIVDDEKPTREAMARLLKKKYECFTAPDGESALKELSQHPDIALVLTDYKMPGMNGSELIKTIKSENASIACILITAFGEIELAVEAMKDGADDFLVKPITDIDQLELRIKKALDKHHLMQRVEELQDKIDPKRGLEDCEFTGESEAMLNVYKLIRKAAKSSANVIIQGPTGTGKELVAKSLHNLSSRSDKPYIVVNCSQLSPSLIQSELFGHEKGAFTDAHEQRIGRFEAADGGTIFLDEITEIDSATQVMLLRVIEQRTFQRVGGTKDIKSNFRLVVATNRDIGAYVKEGKFREDLYYRLNVIKIVLPPLRERPGDIPLLVKRFIKEFSEGESPKKIDAEALKFLEKYDWPGNVRQLRSVIQSMTALSDSEILTVDDIPQEISSAPAKPSSVQNEETMQHSDSSLMTLREAKEKRILETLERNGNNITAAAKELGISRRTIHRMIKK